MERFWWGWTTWQLRFPSGECGRGESAASIRRRRSQRHDLADRRRGMAGPTQAHEPTVGIVEIIETVEEVHAGIDERRPDEADEMQPRRRERIAARAESESIERLRRGLGRDRDRDPGSVDQGGRAAMGRSDRVRRLARGDRQVHRGDAGIHEQAAAGGGRGAVDRDADRRLRPVLVRPLELDIGEITLRVGRGQPDEDALPGDEVAAPQPLRLAAVDGGDVEERVLARPALLLVIVAPGETY